jgi:hypothetical protein
VFFSYGSMGIFYWQIRKRTTQKGGWDAVAWSSGTLSLSFIVPSLSFLKV